MKTILIISAACLASALLAQAPNNLQRRAGDGPPPGDGPPQFGGGPGGPGGPGGFRGFGPMGQEMKVVSQFDKDGDKRLNAEERKAAREFVVKERASGRGPGGIGRGGRGGFGPGNMLAPQMLSQADKNSDQKLTKEEFTNLADTWFNKLDSAKSGKLNEEQFSENFSDLLPPPGGAQGEPPRGFGPGRFIGPALFTAFDQNKDGSLTRGEMKESFAKWFADWDSDKTASLNEEQLRNGLMAVLPRPNFGGPGGPVGPGGRGRGSQEPPKPGPKISPEQVKSFPDAPVYDLQVVRTFFLEFENSDWEKEMVDFNNTDVEIPAKLMVDGKTFKEVGVHFRGMSSFGVGEGRKRSLNLSLDYIHENQNLGGYRTFNLLNSHEDPTFLRTILYLQIARDYLAAPKANFVRVVINGESWGIYVNQQQFNKDFTKDWFKSGKGARWKVPGSPRGAGSLAYLGDDVQKYKGIYEIKTKDDPKDWADFIKLCRVLNQTPAAELQKELEPLLDIDGALKFLALENVLINNDGYWIRTSDYCIYQDEKRRFHIIPHDANETFAMPGGPGGRGGGPGGRGGGPGAGGAGGAGGGGRGGPGFGGPQFNGVQLDPLVAAADENKPLISKLLAVPELRARYLGYVRDIAEKWLDWDKLGPVIQQYQALIAEDVKADTRKLDSTEAFTENVTENIQGGGFGPREKIGLKNFVEQRRKYLLGLDTVKSARL
jgi:hypothetical protein